LTDSKRRLPEVGGLIRSVCDFESASIDAVTLTSTGAVGAQPASVSVPCAVPLGSVVADVVSVTLPGGQVDEKVTVTGCVGGDPAESVTLTDIDALP